MRRMRWIFLPSMLLACIVCAHIAQAEPTVYPTGTTIFKPDKAQPDVFIMTVAHNYIAIIDRNGNEYNRWPIPKKGLSNIRARLDRQGNLLVAGAEFASAVGGKNTWEMNQPATIVEYAWTGEKRWEQHLPDWHNEIRKLDNGNIIYTMYENIPAEYLAKVKDVALPWGATFQRKGVKIRGDVLQEMEPKTGKVVWEWKTWEHLDINRCSPLDPANDWTHLNTISILPPNKWYDAGDKRFAPGNILINPRNLDEFYIIEKKSGKVVWTGNHSYKTGLSHPHEPYMIAKGLVGEGNILFFDNGLYPKTESRVGRSLVGELNPTTGELEWKYETSPRSGEVFWSRVQGSQERLKNGNTFIAEDYAGRLFEVTRDSSHRNGGEIVWEYIMPMPNEWSQRSRIYPDDYCPQMKAIKRVCAPYAVIPPKNADFHLPK